MKNFALKVAYIGYKFYGFQRQPDFRTIEGEIIDTLMDLGLINGIKESKFSIAGRTDKGVHSLGNVISFQSEKEPFINQINNHLDEDIQIIAKSSVHFGFKPRYPLMRHYRYFLKDFHDDDLDVSSLKELAKLFKGTHDFTNFTKRNQRMPIRKINKVNVCDIKKDNETLIYVDVFGKSFLWNMVRNMMAVFRDVGKGKLEIDDINDYFNPSFNTNIRALAPENLILMDSYYKNVNFKYDDYALERFKRVLEENILEYKRKCFSRTNILFSLLDKEKLHFSNFKNDLLK
ncbi:MAG: tRNA pseudouridine(38-40) synthase TruA [Methanobrevibacter sp.]|jgi:tRNA pseudouridine38-40 synthase|nr:tRNA pseudouridine(38-40) synthase TruA [Methanobrevibacter sp.]